MSEFPMTVASKHAQSGGSVCLLPPDGCGDLLRILERACLLACLSRGRRIGAIRSGGGCARRRHVFRPVLDVQVNRCLAY